MRKIHGLLLACSISVASNAQITALNPTAEGGFEAGSSFLMNGWTTVDPSAAPINTWTLSNAAPAYGGARGAHISNDGASYTYSNTATRTCHLYRDITVPPGAVNLNLGFYWKGMGQVGADRLLVYTAPTFIVPVANAPASPSTTISGATLVWTQTSTSSVYAPVSISLPPSLAGTNVRIIFTWQNDATGGTNPGAAIDNISFTYECGTPASITGNAPMCVGNTVSLSNIFTGGSWSSSNTGVATVSTSGVITGVNGGTSTISYTSGSCLSTAVVTVSPLPAPITGNDIVCVGATTAFANAVLGGTWSSSYPAVASVMTSSGIITGHVAGGSYITYTMPGGCWITDTVNVVNPPSPITGGMSICPGTSTDLNSSGSGGSWTSLNPGSASVNPANGIVTGIHADTAQIKYTSAAGCSVFATVTINPLPDTIISRDIMCAQGKDTAYDATPGGTWSSVTPALGTIDPLSGHFTPLAGGIAVIKYTLSTTCARTKTITLNPLPVPNVTYTWFTNTLYTDSGYVAYQWYHTLFGAIPDANTFRTAGVFNGNYYVEVTDSNGCVGRSALFAYNTSMGVGAVTSGTEVAIYPNPATDHINVIAPSGATTTVAGMDGRIILSSKQNKISLTELPTGIFMVTVTDTEGRKILTEKLARN